MPRTTYLLHALACLLAALNTPACAEDFYKGKTITLLVGSAEGGGYDQYARLLARHMGKYIAGEPAIVQSINESSFEGLRFVFFAGSAAFAAKREADCRNGVARPCGASASRIRHAPGAARLPGGALHRMVPGR